VLINGTRKCQSIIEGVLTISLKKKIRFLKLDLRIFLEEKSKEGRKEEGGRRNKEGGRRKEEGGRSKK